MQKRNTSFMLILSIINWFPIIVYVFIYPPSPFSAILLLLSFCSPIIAVIYIITIVFMMFKKLLKISPGIFLIVINIGYLLWSKYYLDVMYHMT